MTALNVLYEDDDIIVCVKPAGISSQTERSFDPDMVSQICNYLAIPNPYVGVIHRLDKPVSGVMVYAKTKKAAAILSKELSLNSFSKNYYAIVHCDSIDSFPSCGTLKNFLLHDVKSNSSSVVGEGVPGAKEAILEYKVIGNTVVGKDCGLALLDINLITGRHHQIRVQLSHAGLPIFGDKKYGIEVPLDIPFMLKRAGLALCAYSLTFTHPITGKTMKFVNEPKGKLWEMFFEK